MHIDDGACARLLAAKVEEGKEPASMVSMPVRYHHAFNWRKRCAKTGKVAREGFRLGTCVKEREAGDRVGGVMCFLVHCVN